MNKYESIAKENGIYNINNNEKVTLKELNEVIMNIVIETIKESQPHIFIYQETPFINQYNERVSIDCSGKVESANIEDILKLENELNNLDLWEHKNY